MKRFPAKHAVVASLLSLTVLSTSAFAAKVAVDTKASVFDWKGSKVTGSSHHGKVVIKEADLEMDGKKLIGGHVVVDMTTITDEDLTDKTYNEKLITHLKSDDFFDVAKYPTAALTIKGSEIQPDGSYKLNGDLQIKNETHPVAFVAKLAPDSKSAEADLVVDRTDWNVRYGSGKFFKNLGDKMIDDKMEFKVKLVFKAPAVSETPSKPEKAAAKKKK